MRAHPLVLHCSLCLYAGHRRRTLCLPHPIVNPPVTLYLKHLFPVLGKAVSDLAKRGFTGVFRRLALLHKLNNPDAGQKAQNIVAIACNVSHDLHECLSTHSPCRCIRGGQACCR